MGPKQKQTLAIMFCSPLLVPAPVFAQEVTGHTIDRWKLGPQGSYLNGLNVPLPIANALPQLAEDGIKTFLKDQAGELLLDNQGNPIPNAVLVYSEDGLRLTVDQESSRLLGYWDSFNIGAENSVTFAQPTSDSVALNIIEDQSPTQIFGSLNCNAACWLVNPNGVFFGDGAQVNTRGLLAAAMEFQGLPMDGGLVMDTERNWIERDNLFDGINSDLPFLTRSDTDELPEPNSAELPRVIVEKGVVINSDNAPALLAGPEVINEGSINSENGQVVLAGSRKDVYVALTQPGIRIFDTPGADERSEQSRRDKAALSRSYRGVLVEVNSGSGSKRGAVVNAGEITANFGNVTLVSSEIVQAGRLASKTAVDVNGTIRLLARDQANVNSTSQDFPGINSVLAPLYYLDDDTSQSSQLPFSEGSKVAIGTESGSITLTGSSRIDISADGSERTAADADSFRQPRSQINIEGRYITMETGAAIVAPNGNVTVRALEDPTDYSQIDPTEENTDFQGAGDAYFSMGEDSIIDVSGTEDALLDASRNNVTFFLTSNEFKDTPQQKEGNLLRETVTVDIQRGTELFDWSVALENQQRSASERSASGGDVSILSLGQISIDEGASIDVSGGKVNYQAGYVESTRLVGPNGFVDISEANPLANYLGTQRQEFVTLNDGKWGEVQNFRPGVGNYRYYRNAYHEGKNAGTITLTAPRQAVSNEANFVAGVNPGAYQRQAAARPQGGSIGFDFRGGISGETPLISIKNETLDIESQILNRELQLSKAFLEGSGAESIRINTVSGAILLDADVSLQLVGTDVALTGNFLEIAGDIRTVGGDITLEQVLLGGEGRLYVNGILDTSGAWTNDNPSLPNTTALASTNVKEPIKIDAGSINLSAQTGMEIGERAAFIANAGAWMDKKGKLNIGKAGDIGFIAQDISNFPVDFTVADGLRVSALDGGSGGTLTLTGESISFGDYGASVIGRHMQIDNDFFQAVAVNNFNFIALDGNIDLTETAHIQLGSQKLLVDQDVAFQSSNNDAGLVLNPTTITQGFFTSPASLSLSARRTNFNETEVGILQMAEGASITGPADSNITFRANNRMLIDGKIDIVGGSVTSSLTQLGEASGEISLPSNYIWLGNNADINLNAGVLSFSPEDADIPQYRFFDAGSLSVDAVWGYAIVAPEADINLRGADFNVAQRLYRSDMLSEVVNSSVLLDAGEFSLRGERGFDMGAKINFGDPGAAHRGGTLRFTLDANGRSTKNNTGFAELAFVLGSSRVGTTGNQLAFGDELATEYFNYAFIGQELSEHGNVAQLTIDANNTAKAGFYQNKLILESDFTLAASEFLAIDAASLDVNSSILDLNAAIVTLGESNSASSFQNFIVPSLGSGSLYVNADKVELTGNMAVSGVDQVEIVAREGLRFRQVVELDGNRTPISGLNVFTTAGNLRIGAPVIWGTTLSNFAFDLTGSDGVFDLGRVGRQQNSLISFGSNLQISASEVLIDSLIHNPWGSIAVNAQNSLVLGPTAELSVAGSDAAVPFGRVFGSGSTWAYNFDTGADGGVAWVLQPELPEKSINLKANSVEGLDGSKINLAGGGAVYAREFVAGLGGTRDFLNEAHYTNSFALLPSHGSGFTPYDLTEFGASGIPLGTRIEIAGSSQLPDGLYTVLPANYALLPGAYLASAESLNRDISQGFNSKNVFGAEVVSARFQHQTAVDSTWFGLRIEPNAVISQRADYRITNADDFFDVAQPGTRPEENGRLALTANQSLDFLSRVISSTNSPVGASFDIASSGDIVIGDNALPGAVQINPDLFTTIGADSILIGGERSWENGAWKPTTLATNVVIDGADVVGTELMLVATGGIQLVNGAQINTTNATTFEGNAWQPSSAGVSLLSSATSGSRLDLAGSSPTFGTLALDATSQIVSGGSLGVIYDGQSSLENLSFLPANGRTTRLQVLTENLILGDTSAGAQLNGQLLAGADTVGLRAGNQIQFNQDIDLDLRAATLQANALVLAQDTMVNISASEAFQLLLPVGAASPVATADNTSLSINAQAVHLGSTLAEADVSQAAEMIIASRDFTITAANGIFTDGNITINAGGDVSVNTPVFAATGPAQTSLLAAGDLFLNSNAADSTMEELVAGGRFHFQGQSVLLDTAIAAQSGFVSLRSTTGDIDIGESARVDLSPFSVVFPSETISAPAGIFSARSAADINIANLSQVNFGDSDSVGGGQLELMAQGNIAVSSVVHSDESEWGGAGTDLRIQANSLSPELWAQLLFMNSKGFDGAWDALATGAGENISLAAENVLNVESLRLATLTGELGFDGTINSAGDVKLHGGSGVAVASTAVLTASNGSEVWLEAPHGGVAVAEGARIATDGTLNIVKDVLDTTTSVNLNDSAIAGVLDLYLHQSFEQANVDNPTVQSLAQALIAQVDAANGSDFVTSSQTVNVKPFLDIYTAGGMAVSGAEIDLTALYTAAGLPGVLQLRASNGIEFETGINAATQLYTPPISVPPELQDQFLTPVLLEGESWGITVAAGAALDAFTMDSSAAYAFDGLVENGNINLLNGSNIHTGTGNINIFASGDINQSFGSDIASLGNTQYDPDTGLPVWGERIWFDIYAAFPDMSGFSENGGDVNLRLAGSLVGTSPDTSAADFMLRLATDQFLAPGNRDYSGVRAWGVGVGLIEGGVHAVGGGRVKVEAGGDIEAMSFSTPSVAIDSVFDQQVDQLIAGGNLAVQSRGNVSHTSWFAEGPTTRLRSAGFLGTDEAPIFLMGANTLFDADAAQGVTLVGIANSYSLPSQTPASTGFASRTSGKLWRIIPETTSVQYSSIFYQGYDQTKLDIASVSGDFRIQSSPERLQAFLPEAEFGIYGSIEQRQEELISLLPSVVDIAALGGDIVIDRSLAVFPSQTSNLRFHAAENIFATVIQDNPGLERLVRISDLITDSLPTLENPFQTGVTAVNYVNFYVGYLQPQIFSETSVAERHADQLIDRTVSEPAAFVALRGNIGSPDTPLSLVLPKAATVYAGKSIIDTSIRIQHSALDDFSSITAGGDILFPLTFSEKAQLNSRDTRLIQLAGPGDLIVAAGGDIELGASGGIRSIGNQENPLLPSFGGNLHVYSGFNRVGDYKALVGNGVTANSDIASFDRLGLENDALASLSFVAWLDAYAALPIPSTADAIEDYKASVEAITEIISRASGNSYRPEKGFESISDVGGFQSALNAAMQDYQQLDASLQLRVSTSAMKEVALANPDFIVQQGQYLFAEPPIGEIGFTSAEQRLSTREEYFNVMGSLIALEYLLTPNRSADFEASIGSDLSALSISELLNRSVSYFDTAHSTVQLLTAAQILNEHTRQSSVEGALAGNAMVSFERGYVNQRRFFGSDYDAALIAMQEKAAAIQAGQVESVDTLTFGNKNGQALGSMADVFAAWGMDLDNLTASEDSGDVNMVFSTIQSSSGGNLGIYAPNGSVDVGLAAAQLEQLSLVRLPGDLGVIAAGRGNINSIVGQNFNVNESRAFSLAGGNLSLWSAYGDIDAGRGAKTTFSSPPPNFVLSPSSGAITVTRPPAVSGSGIRTSPSRSASSEALSDVRRFYEVAEGAGTTYLATALGIVDAGEAGIASAGKLFIAAAEVQGADNIEFGDVSIGVSTSTAVGGEVGEAGNASNATTDQVQRAVTESASGQGEDSLQAFITIELVNTGTDRNSPRRPREESPE